MHADCFGVFLLICVPDDSVLGTLVYIIVLVPDDAVLRCVLVKYAFAGDWHQSRLAVTTPLNAAFVMMEG